MTVKTKKPPCVLPAHRAAPSGKELQRPSRSPFYHNKSQNGVTNRENF